jgi:hypothetical protein
VSRPRRPFPSRPQGLRPFDPARGSAPDSPAGTASPAPLRAPPLNPPRAPRYVFRGPARGPLASGPGMAVPPDRGGGCVPCTPTGLRPLPRPEPRSSHPAGSAPDPGGDRLPCTPAGSGPRTRQRLRPPAPPGAPHVAQAGTASAHHCGLRALYVGGELRPLARGLRSRTRRTCIAGESRWGQVGRVEGRGWGGATGLRRSARRLREFWRRTRFSRPRGVRCRGR